MRRLLVMIAAVAPLPAAAQAIVGDRAACSACEIRATARLTLATAASPAGLAGVPTAVARDGRGRYWVATPGQLPLVFGPRGEFVAEVGRRGDGPGEYRGVAAMAALPGDSVLLVDARLQRASVLGPGLRFARAVPLPVRGGAVAVVSWPDRVVVNSPGFTAAQAGWPLHLVDLSRSAGEHVGSFGDVRGDRAAGNTPGLLRRFSNVAGATFWAVPVTRYQLTSYSAAGRLLRSLRREGRKFPGESPWSIGNPDSPPPPFVDALAVRGDTLWVALRVARPDWQQAWRGVVLPRGGEVAATQVPDPAELHMARIEVIDMRRGILLAHRSFGGIVVNIAPDLTAVLYDLDERDTPRLRLVDLRLAGPAPR